MRVYPIGLNGTLVVLSRTNVKTLLGKLDNKTEDNGTCVIHGGPDAPGFAVMAEEDKVHYARRPAGGKRTQPTRS